MVMERFQPASRRNSLRYLVVLSNRMTAAQSGTVNNLRMTARAAKTIPIEHVELNVVASCGRRIPQMLRENRRHHGRIRRSSGTRMTGRACLIALTVGVCGTVLGAQRASRDTSTDAYRRQQQVPSALALVGEFRADADKAGRTYGGRLLEVDGIVQSTGRTAAGVAFVTSLPDASLMALFDAHNEGEMRSVRVGQRARIRGVVASFARNTVSVEHSLVMVPPNR
jgi:hypothetical protein